MDAAGLHDRYTDLLIERVRSVRYPSKQVMDRAELTLADRERALEYAEILIEKADTRYPSLELLDRINRVLLVLEATESREEGDAA